MKSYTLKIVDIIHETFDTITLCFKQPALKKINYLAGQYLTVVFRINGRRYLRPYSFSSCPQIDSTLNITIKRVENGLISNYIHENLSIGDIVEVLEPLGDFVSDQSFDQVFLWGGGSGITPLFSIIKDLLYNSNSYVHLIYGNRNRENTIFYKKLNELQSIFIDRLYIDYFFSKESSMDLGLSFYEGRISEEYINKVINSIDLQFSKHFICGPVDLKKNVIKVLTNKNVLLSQVVFEDFELIINPSDLVGVIDREVSVDFKGDKINLEVLKGKTILESLLDIGVEIPYSCQTGNCNTCKAEIIQGNAKMIGLTKERTDLDTDEILLCCAYPLSEEVIIKINS